MVQQSSTPPRYPRERGPARGVVEILPVPGMTEITAGDDLAAILHAALIAPGGPGLRPGDVLCVSTKVVSKALGLVIDPADKQRAVEAATVRLVARRRHDRVTTSVVQTPHGAVMAAAGIDGSNSPEGLLLLPEDPDAEAERLRDSLSRLVGFDPGIILTDTSSRIWRRGVGDIALGCAGVSSLQDLRGTEDAQGHRLSVTVRDLADELAAAADLVKGKATGVPAAVVRGVPGATSLPVPARELSRLPPEDWFARPSLESAWQALGIAAADEPTARMEPEPEAERIDRALEIARTARGDSAGPSVTAPSAMATSSVRADGSRRILIHPADGSREAMIGAGVLAERIRTALAAEHHWSPLPAVDIEIADCWEGTP